MTPRFSPVFLPLFLAAALSAAGQEVDLYTPPLQALKNEYKKATADAAKTREDALREMVQKHLREGEAMLADKKKTGNITGMAIARNIITIFEECSQGLQKSKDFTFPERVRRELAETIEACRKQKKEIDERYAAAVAPLDTEYYNRFVEKVTAQVGANLAESQLRTLFKSLVASEDRVATQPGETKQPGGETKAPGPVAETPPEVPEILGASGPAKSWVSIGYWTAEVSGVEVVNIPVLKIDQSVKQTLEGEGSGQTFTTVYRPLAVLTAGTPGLAFQVKSLPKRLGVDIMEWPSAANRWSFLVRVKPWVVVPSKHGMEIQVAAGAAVQDLATLAASQGGVVAGGTNGPGAAVPIPPAVVTLTFKSDPAGAFVHLDGKPAMLGNAVARTPCVVETTAGKRDISLKLFGYRDGNYSGFNVATNATIDHKFSKDTTLAESSLKVFAREGWRESQVSVNKDDRLSISVSGTWSCLPREEMVGPEGYPQDAAHQGHYFGASALPRVHARARLGALLMKIGANGGIRVLGRNQQIVAEAAGTLYFGVNEADRNNSLADNKGGLTIYIQNFGSGAGR